MTIQFPSVPIASSRPILTRNQRRPRSPYGGRAKTIDYGAFRGFELTFVPTLESEALALEAWLEAQDNFLMSPPGYTFPTGKGTARIQGTGQTGLSIKSAGRNRSEVVLKG